MKQETHVFSRSLQLLMGGAYLLVLLVNGTGTIRRWGHMELWEKVLFVGSFTTHFVNYHTPENVRFGLDKNPGANLLLTYLQSTEP